MLATVAPFRVSYRRLTLDPTIAPTLGILLTAVDASTGTIPRETVASFVFFPFRDAAAACPRVATGVIVRRVQRCSDAKRSAMAQRGIARATIFIAHSQTMYYATDLLDIAMSRRYIRFARCRTLETLLSHFP